MELAGQGAHVLQHALALPASAQGKGKQTADGKTSTSSAFPLGPGFLQHKNQQFEKPKAFLYLENTTPQNHCLGREVRPLQWTHERQSQIEKAEDG